MSIEDSPSEVLQEIITVLESNPSSPTPKGGESSNEDFDTLAGGLTEKMTDNNPLPDLPPKQREIKEDLASKTVEIPPKNKDAAENEEEIHMKSDNDPFDASHQSSISDNSTYDIPVELERKNPPLTYATVDKQQVKELIEQQENQDKDHTPERHEKSDDDDDDSNYDLPPPVSSIEENSPNRGDSDNTHDGESNDIQLFVGEESFSKEEQLDILPSASVDEKRDNDEELYDNPPTVLIEANSSSEGESYDRAPPFIPPKCKTTGENFFQNLQPPKLPPKIKDLTEQKSSTVSSTESGQLFYLDLVSEGSSLERKLTSASGYELPQHEDLFLPSVANEKQDGSTEAMHSTWNNTYEHYKALPLPESPSTSSNNIDMRNYTPLEINLSKSNSNNSLDSSISSAIGLNQYEKDTSLSYSNPKHKKEGYYASLVTLSKREASARKETLMAPWYVVSIGVGHIDLRKKVKKENKTLEFFRSLSVSASSAQSTSQKESLLIAWKVGN